MGIWGPGLYSNDDALDLKAMFKELIAYGKSTNKAVAEIRKEFDMDPPDEMNCDAWLALADTSWKYGRLTEEIKQTALDLISSEMPMKNYRNVSQSFKKKRQQVLQKLDVQLHTDMGKEKKPKPDKLYSIDWSPGQIYSRSQMPFRSGFLDATSLLYTSSGS